MIKIALDEGGRFEHINNDSKCMFVGGVVFKYETETDYRKELNRIKRFFSETCEEQKCSILILLPMGLFLTEKKL